MNEAACHVAVIIVGFRNPEDICNCLNALALATPNPSFDIFICENGGKEAFQELNDALVSIQGPCNIYPGNRSIPANTSRRTFAEVKCLTLKKRSTLVWTARAIENLGYAGGINAWLNRLQTVADWNGVWVLNPDTMPYPNALAELVHRSVTGNKGMVSCTLVPNDRHDYVYSRGLWWNTFLARTTGIGNRELVRAPYDLDEIEAIMDSPSGASMYATRACIEHVGPMDDRFFLYYEDIDWGIRAKEFGLGYAGQSIVPHEGGTTIGESSARRANRSALTVYLESRNRLLFVRKHFPWISVLASCMGVAHAFQYLLAGSPNNFEIALEGILAGWNGETGPPPHHYNGHFRAILSNLPMAVYGRVKLAISLVYYCGQVIWRAALCTVGGSPRPRLIILYYHGVADCYRFEFARQMNMLLRSANVIPADFQGTLSSKIINVAITFDDAFESIVENALPELACRSFHSTVFVPVGAIGHEPNWFVDDGSTISNEVVMTAERIKSLSPTLVSIGAHGLRHLHLARIDRHQAKVDIEQSRDFLKILTGREIKLFAFPYGDYDEHVIQMCKSVGLTYVYATDTENVDVLGSNFVRGRVKADPTDGQMEFFLKINGAYNWLPKAKSIARWLSRRWPTASKPGEKSRRDGDRTKSADQSHHDD